MLPAPALNCFAYKNIHDDNGIFWPADEQVQAHITFDGKSHNKAFLIGTTDALLKP